jgi:membrane fusion protein, multidrug efflux system
MISRDSIKALPGEIRKYAEKNKYTLKLAVTLLLVMFLTAQVKGCIARNYKPPVHPRPVQTAQSFKKDVPLYVDSFGTLTSPGSVDIKAQVTGKILEVSFEQGSEVKKGDVLFVIDPAPYKAELDKAEAALAEDTVNMRLKLDTLERNRILFEKDLISQQEFEQYHTEATAAVAKVELDRANIQSANINLEYCYVRSPLSGLAGKRQVDPGNIVPANTGPTLVNIKTVSEFYVDFTLPERDLASVRGAMEKQALEIHIIVPGDEQRTFLGKLDFIDNAVDDRTGTFALRATVKNDERALWSGQFVTVRLILGMARDAVLVPYAAPQIGKNGYYVFVVTRGKADLRQVVLGTRDGDDVVIEKGVNALETVVTVGQMGLAPGMPVIDVTEKMKKAAKKK